MDLREVVLTSFETHSGKVTLGVLEAHHRACDTMFFVATTPAPELESMLRDCVLCVRRCSCTSTGLVSRVFMGRRQPRRRRKDGANSPETSVNKALRRFPFAGRGSKTVFASSRNRLFGGAVVLD